MIIDMKRARFMAVGMSVIFLIIHLLMFAMFSQCKVWPMVQFNRFSIIFYLVMMIVGYMGWLTVYAPAVYLEVVLHMALAVLFTGWENGFQITLIGMNVLAFYAEYIGRTLKLKYIPMLPACLIGMAAYLGTFLYEHWHPAAYDLPKQATFILTLIWGVVVFTIIIAFLQMFVLMVNGSEEKLEFQMSHDKLTKLPNRYYLSQQLDEIQEAEGFEDYFVAIGDIDDFKKVNDTYGHNCGDYVLATVAELAAKVEDVICCRWGGEEFIFVGKYSSDIQTAFDKLDAFRKRVESFSFLYEGQQLKVTMTLGLAEYDTGLSRDEWLSDADQKLYYGKHNGKNQVVY